MEVTVHTLENQSPVELGMVVNEFLEKLPKGGLLDVDVIFLPYHPSHHCIAYIVVKRSTNPIHQFSG